MGAAAGKLKTSDPVTRAAVVVTEAVMNLRLKSFEGHYAASLKALISSPYSLQEPDAVLVLQGKKAVAGRGVVADEIPEIRSAYYGFVTKVAAYRNVKKLPPWMFDLLDEIYAEEDAAAARAIEAIRAKVIEFADQDKDYPWVDFTSEPEEGAPAITLRLPGRALACYALSSARARHLMPEYTPFSPMGLKQQMDNPFHTDVVLGAGFMVTGDDAYKPYSPADKALNTAMYELQRKLLGFEFGVLARGDRKKGYLYGVAWDPGEERPKLNRRDKEVAVFIVPSAEPMYEVQARKAGCVITEVGGRLCHLAVVARESGVPLLMVPGAVNKFRHGARLFIHLNDGTLSARFY